MTERSLLIKFCVSDSSNSFSAIAADAPTSIRVFNTNNNSNNNNSNTSSHLVYTVSAIPPEELLNNNNNFFDSSVIGSAHSTINEALTALNMSSSSSTSSQESKLVEQEDSAVQNFSNKKSFECELVMGTSSGRVSLFDCISGKLRWSRFVPDGSNVAVRAVACSCGFVFVATARQTISVFESMTGRIVFNGAKFAATSSSTPSSSNNNNLLLSSAVGSVKSMSALHTPSSSTVYAFVGGLQPIAYRMNATQQNQQKVLEPFAVCRVQSAPPDRVCKYSKTGRRSFYPLS